MSQIEQIDNQEERGYPKIVDTRLRQLYYAIEDSKSEALVITHVPHVRYLTNFSGSAATLFVTEDELHFVTDDRYEEQIKDELFPLPNLKTHISRDPWELISENKILKNITTIAFEADQLYYSDAILIRNQIRPVKFKPVAKMVEPFTIPKSPEELANIEKAAEIAVQVYEKILTIIKPGMTEKDIDTEI
nr:aminopeptidase P family N-terminal domain-containing protein [Candidatus Kapabacteria bacterium]